MNLFTYGSLMYAEVWSRVMNGGHPHQRATVTGYSRRRLPGEVYPAMIAAEGDSIVEGVLYANVTTEEIARLDRFEDEGVEYKRITVEADPGDGAVAAFTYVYMHPDRVSPASWDPAEFEREGLQHFLDSYVRERE